MAKSLQGSTETIEQGMARTTSTQVAYGDCCSRNLLSYIQASHKRNEMVSVLLEVSTFYTLAICHKSLNQNYFEVLN
jgi:hypothetical protein